MAEMSTWGRERMSQKACFLSDPLQSKFAGSHSNPEHLCDIQVG